MMTQALIREELAANLRAARARADIGQEELAAAMRALGFSAWWRQTVSETEHGKRRILAEEICALATILETSAAMLMSTDRSPA